MSIVYASKSGDALGNFAFRGMSKRQKQEYAKKKLVEKFSSKYREYVKKQRQVLGLE